LLLFASSLTGCGRSTSSTRGPLEQTTIAPSASASAAAPVGSARAPGGVQVRVVDSSALLRDDRKALATWSGETGDVQLWDLDQGLPTERVACTKGESFNTLAWGHDGRFLACIAGQTIDFFDLSRHDRWHPEVSLIERSAFSPDGASFAWGNDNGFGEVLDVRNKRRPISFSLQRGEAAAMVRFFFNPDSTTVAVVESAQSLHLWDTRTGKKRARIDLGAMGMPEEPAVTFSPDGALLAFPDARGIKVVDGHTGAAKKTFAATAKDHAPTALLAFTTDAGTIVSMSRERVEVGDVKSGKLRASLAKESSASEMALAPDGAQIAFGGGDEESWLWDLRGSEARSLGKCSGLAFTRDGAKVRCTAADDTKRPWPERLVVFDAQTGARLPKSGSAIPGHDEAFLADPEGAARLFRGSDGAAVRFATLTVGERRLPIVYTDDGHFSGDREAARKLLFRKTGAGPEEPLSDADLAALERKSLLADFVAGRPVTAP
jgi:WD40 repeat protein